MSWFVSVMGLSAGTSVIDLGGTPGFWRTVGLDLDVTIVNLPGGTPQRPDRSGRDYVFVEGDACDLRQFGDRAFAIAFSNSVIEHVGDRGRREAFAEEARRLGSGYWVQTPSKWFPIEAHSGMPFWWFLPTSVRAWFLERWRRSLKAWTEMVEQTTVIDKEELRSLFPDATVVTERLCGIPKSYVAFRLPAERDGVEHPSSP